VDSRGSGAHTHAPEGTAGQGEGPGDGTGGGPPAGPDTGRGGDTRITWDQCGGLGGAEIPPWVTASARERTGDRGRGLVVGGGGGQPLREDHHRLPLGVQEKQFQTPECGGPGSPEGGIGGCMIPKPLRLTMRGLGGTREVTS